MGFFSWQCALCKKSIWNHYTPQGATPCVLLLDNGTVVHEDDYEGYGHFGGIDALEYADPKIVCKEDCWKGQAYKDLPKSNDCPNQGYWKDRNALTV